MEKSRVNLADELHKSGMNCAQSVVCAYCDKLGIDQTIAFKMAEGFGLGMGSMEYICGALSGAIMLIGLKNSSGTTENITKAETHKLAKEITEKFKAKNGSVFCKELKGLTGNAPLRNCAGCIEDACKIIEEYI